MPRIETGVVQFGDDWPGIFIRGDNAFGMAMSLKAVREALKNLPPGPAKAFGLPTLENLIELLGSCDVRTNPEVQHVEYSG